MSKQWNKDIHDRLKDFQKKAPEGLLDDIKSEMHRRGLSPVPAGGSPFIRPRHILRAVSAAAILLIVSFIGYRWNESSPTFVKDAHHPSEPESIQPMALSELKPSATGLIAPVTTKPAARIPKLNVSASDILPIEHTTNSIENAGQTAEETESTPIAEKEKQQNKKTHIATHHSGKVVRNQKRIYTSDHKKNPIFAIGTHVSGIVAHSGPKDDLFSMNNEAFNPPHGDSTTNTTKVGTHPIYRHKQKKVHHKPIKAAVSFRYNIKPKWHFQSGLVYSYMVSEFSEHSFFLQQVEQTKQKLHYIGVPVQIGYQVWQKKRFSGYIDLGGQVEKMISGKAASLYWEPNYDQRPYTYLYSRTKSVSDKHLTFSALASIGAEYHLGHTVSLYAEPSVHYYFKNGSGLENHYTKQPLNFNLTIGLRFHWGK